MGGGAKKAVTEGNKRQYAQAYALYKLAKAEGLEECIRAFRRGLFEVVPQPAVELLGQFRCASLCISKQCWFCWLRAHSFHMAGKAGVVLVVVIFVGEGGAILMAVVPAQMPVLFILVTTNMSVT